MPFDLGAYYERFDEACGERGFESSTAAYQKLESDFHMLQDEKQLLSVSDVERLEPFWQFFGKPGDDVMRKIEVERISLGLMPQEREVVRLLWNVFHNISHVSLILRFTCPEKFGIYSAPIPAYLLLVRGSSEVEEYCRYLKELREWRNHFKMEEVARTEMALWAFYELTKGENPSDDAKRRKKDFQEDVWIQGRRASQALRPFFDRTTHRELQLAEILTEQHPKLAALIAVVQFELLLKSYADKQGVGYGKAKGWLYVLVRDLAYKKFINSDQEFEMKEIWDIRREVVHAYDTCEVDAKEAREMICTICRLFTDLGELDPECYTMAACGPERGHSEC